MKLGYTILYVEDVGKTLTFYEQAFGLKRKSLHEGEAGSFGELETGNSTLAFSSHSMLKQLGLNPSFPDSEAPCFEFALLSDDIAAALKQAIQTGARLVQDVKEAPWGQFAYVTDPNGFLVDLFFEHGSRAIPAIYGGVKRDKATMGAEGSTYLCRGIPGLQSGVTQRPSTDGTNGAPSEYHSILYVEDVGKTLAFYEQAFGLQRKTLSESGDFGELDTGSTTLTFVSRTTMTQLGIRASPPQPGAPCFEIALVTDDVTAALKQAVQAGAHLVQGVEEMPWGQTTAYVADPEGFLVEICSPVAG